jgi:hypothetical protein
MKMPKTFKEIVESLDLEDQKVIQSSIDAIVTKGIKSYSENHPGPDKQFYKLSERLEKIEAAKKDYEKKMELKFIAFKYSSEKGLPFSTIEDLLPMFTDEAVLKSKIEALANMNTDAMKKANERFIVENGYKPKGGLDLKKDKIDISRLTPNEVIQLEMSDNLNRLIKH